MPRRWLALRLSLVAAVLSLTACLAEPARHAMNPHPQEAGGAQATAYLSSDGVQIFGQWWNIASPQAVVLIVHGTALNSGFYAPFAQHLNEAGYAVGAIDLRDWGQSGGEGQRPGFVRDYSEYVLDLQQLAKDARHRYPGKPIYLLGESMGGTVVLLSQIERAVAVNGIILNAPAVWANPGMFGWHLPHALVAPAMWSAKVVGETFPNLPLIPLWRPVVDEVFFDPDAQQRFESDPYNTHTWLPGAYIDALYRAMFEVRSHLTEIKAPMLILQGTRDNLVPLDSSQYLCQHSASNDRSLIFYEGMSHSTLHDYGRESVWGDIVHWLNDHVQHPPTPYDGCPRMVDALRPPSLSLPHRPTWLSRLHWPHPFASKSSSTTSSSPHQE